MRTYQGLLASVMLVVLLTAGCQDGVVDAPEAPDALQAKVEQAIAEDGHYAIPEAEYAAFGVTPLDLDLLETPDGVSKNAVCDVAEQGFSAGRLVAVSCAASELISWQGGLYHLFQALAVNGARFNSDAIPVPRESKVCAVTIRQQGSFIAENDCVAEPHSYEAQNYFALLIPANDGPYTYNRDVQHTWRLGGQLFAAATHVSLTITPIP